MQARGENLFALLKGFTSAPELQNSSVRDITHGAWASEKRPTYFDVFGLVMVMVLLELLEAAEALLFPPRLL